MMERSGRNETFLARQKNPPIGLALIGTALYPVLVHRTAAPLHACSPRSVTLPQLRFTSFAVVSSRRELADSPLQTYLGRQGKLRRKLPPPGKRKIYSDPGGDPLDSLYAPTHGMLAERLRDRGYTDEQVMLRVYPGRGHNEEDWAARVDVPLVFMMGTQVH